jgi:hypothetical protein
MCDDTYLAVLGTQDLRQLCELLVRPIPEAVMPLKGQSPLLLPVVLMLVHNVSFFFPAGQSITDIRMCLARWVDWWECTGRRVVQVFNVWLQRAATVLSTNDPLIATPYTARILPSVQQMLNTMKQRIAILHGTPVELARAISEICVL